MLKPSLAEAPQKLDQGFNNDLLLGDDDQRKAALSFPQIFPLLDFPELRQMFEHFDEMANESKRKLRRAGLAAIVLGALALLGASTQPLLEGGGGHDKNHLDLLPTIVIILSALAGLSSIVISAFGVFNSRFKRTWLEGRLMTERLRQFQFQTLVHRTSSILDTLAGQQTTAMFRCERDQWLARFRLDYESHLAGKLVEIMEDDVDEQLWRMSWLYGPQSSRWQPAPSRKGCSQPGRSSAITAIAPGLTACCLISMRSQCLQKRCV
jgi:hypothetical protein